MKLKSVMGESFLREFSSPSFLPKGIPAKEDSGPCNVSGNSTWNDSDGSSSKAFSFKSRQPMHSFCGYIFGLEQDHGIQISLSYNSADNTVNITVPHHSLGGNHFTAFFREIDNIHYDVIESFKHD